MQGPERKSKDTEKLKKDKPLYIIKENKEPTVHDYLPEYKLMYENHQDQEADLMVEHLNQFIEENKELVLEEYNSKHQDAIIEGFKRAVAITELFIRSLYVDE